MYKQQHATFLNLKEFFQPKDEREREIKAVVGKPCSMTNAVDF